MQDLEQDLPGERLSSHGSQAAYRCSIADAVCRSVNMELNKALNTLLVKLFRDIMNIEEEVLITGEFTDITINDMHVIEAIGTGGPKPSSVVAKKLSVTMGTLTKSIDRLTRNQYVLRERSEEDKRLVLLSLTEKGMRADAHHQKFHREMIEAAMAQFDEQESKILLESLGGLANYFSEQKKNVVADGRNSEAGA